MPIDPIALLRAIAEEFGKGVRETNLLDANVCTSPTNPDRPWEHLPLPGDIFRHKVEIAFAAHKIVLRANGRFLVVEIPGNLDVDLVSINRRDKIFRLKPSPFKIPSFPSLQIFASSTSGDLKHFLESPSLTLALAALRLKDAESLHIYRNGLVLYLRPESKDGVLSAIETL
jgi:hypothetical protein